jgi:uncharacterized phiE125 gp8 family phage protein
MPRVIVTGPASEPITYQQAADHMRIQSLDEDMDTASIEILERLIRSVRAHLEHSYLNRSLITQTWKYYLDEFPGCGYIALPLPPLQSVTHVKYTDSGGTQTTMTVTTDYLVDIVSTPGRVVLPYLGSWPSATLYPINPIEIQFVCGYGSTPEDVPDEIKQAMLILVADLYENREDMVEKAMSNNRTVDRLLFNLKVWSF